MPPLRLLWLPLLLAACASPTTRMEVLARAQGLEEISLRGGPFALVAFYTRDAPDAETLHVYIDGDGTPWRGPGRPALDPTPRNPLVLRLLALDPAPALYLGRPCYLGQAYTPPCEPWFWTHGRYAEPVVMAMAAALRSWLGRYGNQRLTLIGHSGGGTLAWLLATRVPRVCRVITLAANLDLSTWTRLHGYSPLVGSLDPARLPPLPAQISQWHFAGGKDAVVPPALLRRVLRGWTEARFRVLPGVDHRHGWEAIWPKLLRRIQAEDDCDEVSRY